MKILNSVDCQGFFKDEIERGREAHYCIKLSPSGQILELVEPYYQQECHLEPSERPINQNLIEFLKWGNSHQILYVKISKQSCFFDDNDWQWIEVQKELLKHLELPLVDFVKLSPFGACSLLKYEQFDV